MASTANSTSEEGQSVSGGPARSSAGSGAPEHGRAGAADFSVALGSILSRSMRAEEHSSSSRFSAMIRDLKAEDSTRRMMALTELSEYLSFSSEEGLISFPMETFIPLLLGLLDDPGYGDETAGQAMLLSCRCLFNVVDVFPPTTRIIAAAGGLPVLCQNLLNVAYIDVAELAVAIIERISDEQPLQVLKAGGLQAILTFLDFFQIAVQRQAVNSAALMLLPIPPMDIFDSHVRPVLPTLATLLQHNDPQVLQSVCECWRRVLDNTAAMYSQPRPGSGSAGSTSSLRRRMVAKGRWCGSSSSDRGKKEKPVQEEPAEESNSSGSAQAAAPVASMVAARPLAAVLEEMCPSSVVSNLLMLLANGISSPSPQASNVMSEVLYILAVLTNYSDTFTREVLQQEMSAILKQIVFSMDLSRGGHSSSQASITLLRVLGVVASLLPAVHLVDYACQCEAKRLALFKESPEHLDSLGETFLPLLVDIYEASIHPAVQSLCLTLLIAFLLACREQPQTIQRSVDSTRLACFLANLLLAGASRSVTFACLLIVHELLERLSTPYSVLFVRHGVDRGVHQVLKRAEDSQRKSQERASGLAVSQGQRQTGAQLVEEVARRLLSTHFASSAQAGDSAILCALGKIAKQLRLSPTVVIPAHREALTKLHDLLLAPDGITDVEFTCSGTASAMNSFLYPALPKGSSDSEVDAAYGDRLRLLLDCMCRSTGNVFIKLVHLCVAAVQRNEQEPLNLFPMQASPTSALPPHLRLQALQPQGSKGDPSFGGRNPLGVGGELPLSLGARGLRGRDAGGSSASTSLSVLRLLAKPVRIRVAPHGSSRTPPPGGSLANFRTLLIPFGGKTNPSLPAESKEGGMQLAPPRSALLGKGASSAEPSPTPAASPATRLRNYLASKVSRKRSASSSAGPATSTSSTMPPEKRSSMSGLLKGRAHSSAVGPSATAASAAEKGAKHAGRSRATELDLPDFLSSQAQAMSEAIEAVLLVEPLASVAALEDYIWERHGPRCGTPESGGGSSSSSGGPPGSQLPPSGMAASSAGSAARATKREASKQAAVSGEAGAAPGTPAAISEPDAARRGAPPAAGPGLIGRGHRRTAPSSAPADAQAHRKRVQVYLNSNPLTSKTSVVQALVAHAASPLRSRHPTEDHRESRCGGADRYLVSTEDDSSSEVEEDESATSIGARTSSRHFCATIWGRVHAMTYELVDEARPPHDAAAVDADATGDEQAMGVVLTDFDCLVHRHRKIPARIRSSQVGGAPEQEGESGGDGNALTTMLQLISAVYNLGEYIRLSQDCGATEVMGLRVAEDEAFQCNSLTSKLLRQLSDPLAICTGSIPGWCAKLSGTCRFLFPQSARRVLHHSCNLGLSRALHHVQQRTLAQSAHSQEAQRRLEGEVAATSIPRQKVRISRQRILESAIKVMNLYGSSNTILEVEFVGEVGTGSGPTLEFYTQVAEILRTSEPRLFRERVPGGMLFPEPRNPEWLRKGEGQAAQIIERFRLLGQTVAKCILDNRLIDLQLHPFFWRSVLGKGPFSQRSLREVDPTLHTSLQGLKTMEAEALSALCVDFTLPGQPTVQLQPAGADISLTHANVDAYVARVAEVTLVEAIAPQVEAFRSAFSELLPLDTCRIWSEVELTSLIMGSSVQEDMFWTMEHLAAHIKALHGYTSDSRCFRDLLGIMSRFPPESRRKFLTFTTGAPSLPIGGFASLKPPLTVVKKEAPPPPLSPDHFMPSVMTCANYFKLPEYSSAEILGQKLELAINEGQSAFLLS